MKRDVIAIRGLEVRCVVGVYPHEREQSQPLLVDLEMAIDPPSDPRREGLDSSVCYHAVAGQIAFLLEACRFKTLEMASHAIATYLLAPPGVGEKRAAIEGVRLMLTKPTALAGRAVPSLTIEREAASVAITHEEKRFGIVDVILETAQFGIYRLNIAPDRGIPLHIHKVMREHEMVLGEGLLVNGAPVRPGTIHRWPLEAAHRYDNTTGRWQAVLCVDAPAFLPEDEIEVKGEPARATPDVTWTREVYLT